MTTRVRLGIRICACVAGTLALAMQLGGGCETGAPPAGASTGELLLDASSRLGSAGAIKGWGGLAAFDYDNDGDIDLLVTNDGDTPNRLFRNDGAANFIEVGERAGVTVPGSRCVACGVGDFNNDGWLDVILGRQHGGSSGAPPGPILLLNNGPNGGGEVTFREVTPDQTGLTSEAPAMGLGVGDLDNDGLLDIVIGRYDVVAAGFLIEPIYETQPNELWRCTGVEDAIPHFERITTAGIEGTPQHGFSPDTADRMFIPGTWVVYMTDVDADGRLDILDLHDIPGGIDYFHNDGGMAFSPRQMDSLNKHGGWMGIAGGDYDGDGDIDYFITNVGSEFVDSPVPNSIANAHALPDGAYFHKLLRNDGGELVDVTAATPVAPSTLLPPTNVRGAPGLQGTEFGFGATWIDTDNRGLLDLYWIGDLISFLRPGTAFNNHGIGRFLASNGDGSFTDRTAERGLFDVPAGTRPAWAYQDAGRAVAACDLNGDGFDDLVLTNATQFGTPTAATRVFLNPGATGNHWLTVRLQGTNSNRFGIGARVRVRVGDRAYLSEVVTSTSAFCGVQPEARFGLGAATVVDEVEVRWPSGAVTTRASVAADQIITIVEE